MRVLHVIPSVGPARGGPSMAVRTMAEACARVGLSVDVATTNDNDRTLLDVATGIPVEHEGVRYLYFARDSYRYTMSRALGRWVRTAVSGYDVVHVHALFSYSSTVAARAARRARVPYILRPLGTLAPYGMAQHPLLKKISWRMFERSMIEHAAAVHFTSVAERQEAARLGTMRGEVVPLGIDVAKLDATRPAAGGLKLLFLSRVHPKKQIEMVLQALAAVPEATLVVAGAGEPAYVTQVKELSSRLGLDARVTWAGHVDGAEKDRVLKQANAFVLPSINENFGIAVVEALAAGLPAVVSTGVAIHTDIASANAGVIADDTGALIVAFRSLLDAEVRRGMAGNARALAEKSFSSEAMTSGLVSMYERAVALA